MKKLLLLLAVTVFSAYAVEKDVCFVKSAGTCGIPEGSVLAIKDASSSWTTKETGSSKTGTGAIFNVATLDIPQEYVDCDGNSLCCWLEVDDVDSPTTVTCK